MKCGAIDTETKVQCEHDATHWIVGYDHDLERVDRGVLLHRGYMVAGEYEVCEPCIDRMRGWVMFRHFKMEVWALDTYKPQLKVIASE